MKSTGGPLLVITNWNINNYVNVLQRWQAVGQGTLDGPGQQVTAINMAAIPGAGTFGVRNVNHLGLDLQYDPATNSTILGWFEFTGVGEVFLEVGQMGIVRTGAPYPPAEGVNLGFGDEADGLVGDDFNMASSLPDATLTADKDCPWDFDGSGDVGVSDFLDLLGNWGACPPKGDCPWDFDGSGYVGVSDFLELLGNWGPCP